MTARSYVLAALTITTPVVVPMTPIILSDVNRITLQGRFVYGSGGTSVKADIETSLDDGVTWIPIARLAFATANTVKLLNISGESQLLAALSPAALADDTAIGSIMGTRLRAVVTSLGTYAGNTLLDLRALIR